MKTRTTPARGAEQVAVAPLKTEYQEDLTPQPRPPVRFGAPDSSPPFEPGMVTLCHPRREGDLKPHVQQLFFGWLQAQQAAVAAFVSENGNGTNGPTAAQVAERFNLDTTSAAYLLATANGGTA